MTENWRFNESWTVNEIWRMKESCAADENLEWIKVWHSVMVVGWMKIRERIEGWTMNQSSKMN